METIMVVVTATSETWIALNVTTCFTKTLLIYAKEPSPERLPEDSFDHGFCELFRDGISQSVHLTNLTSNTEYEIFFVEHIEGTNSSINNATYLMTVQTAPDPPAMMSAQFSSSGNSLLVTFSSDTDRAASISAGGASFQCETLFSFPGGSDGCLWSSLKVVLITLDAQATVVPGDSLQLLASTLKAACPEGERFCDYWSYSSDASLVISGPAVFPTPNVIAIYSSTISSCSNIAIDVCGSSGSGGRPFQIHWKLHSPADAEISRLLGESFTDECLLVLPNLYLSVEEHYTINVTLTNFLSMEAKASFNVNLVDYPIPSLAIYGPTVLNRFSELVLAAEAGASHCGNGTGSFEYEWESRTDTSLASSSNDQRYFKLPSRSLDTNQVYVFRCTATDTKSGYSNFADHAVYILQSSIRAEIIGGNRAVDPSNSFDVAVLVLEEGEDYGIENITEAVFHWSCFTDSALDCEIPEMSGQSFVVSPVTVVPGSVLHFMVNVSLFDQNVSAAADIFILERSAPSVLIETVVSGKVSPSDKLVLQGPVTTYNISSAAIQWVSSEDFVSGSLSPAASVDITSSTQVLTTTSMYLVVSAGEMLSTTYTFRLEAWYLEADGRRRLEDGFLSTTAYAEISVIVNSPPASGSFKVVPQFGYVLEDTFTLTSLFWVDDDLPLSYLFFQQRNILIDGNEIAINMKSTANKLENVHLALGTGKNYSIIAGANIYDALDAYSTSSKSVSVYPESISLVDLVAELDFLFEAYLPSKYPEITIQIVHLAASLLDAYNCLSAPDCSTLNRESCELSGLINSCGYCLPGFDGSMYDLTTACVVPPAHCSNGANDEGLETDVDCGGACGPCQTGEHCLVDADCSMNLCSNEMKCTTPIKNCSDSCNGHGACVLEAKVGFSAPEVCLASDSSCSAVCQCFDGYAGQSCSYTEEELQNIQLIRSSFVHALSEAWEFIDYSIESIQTMVSSVVEAAQPTWQTLADTQENVMNLLEEFPTESEETGTSENTASLMTQLFSDSLQYEDAVWGRSNSFASFTSSMNDYFGILSEQLVLGESPLEFAEDNFRISVGRYSSLMDQTIAIPSREQYFTSTQTTVSLKGSHSQLSTSTAIMVSELLVNPYIKAGLMNVNNSQSSLVRFRVISDGDGSRRLLLHNSSELLNVTFTLAHQGSVEWRVPNFTQIHLFCNEGEYSTKSVICGRQRQTYECVGTKLDLNVTCALPSVVPECRVWNLRDDAHTHLCRAAHYDEGATTCACSLYGDRIALINELDISVVSKTMVGQFLDTADWATLSMGDDDTSAKRYFLVAFTLGVLYGIVILIVMFAIFEEQKLLKRKSLEKLALEAKPKPKKRRTSYVPAPKLNSQEVIVVPIQLFKDTTFNFMHWLQEHGSLFKLLKRKGRLGWKRFIYGMEVLTSSLTLMFIDALVYSTGYVDTGPCESFDNLEDCLENVNPYNGNQRVCSWNAVSETCYFNQPTMGWETVVYISVLTYIIYLPVAFLIDSFLKCTIARPLKVSQPLDEAQVDTPTLLKSGLFENTSLFTEDAEVEEQHASQEKSRGKRTCFGKQMCAGMKFLNRFFLIQKCGKKSSRDEGPMENNAQPVQVAEPKNDVGDSVSFVEDDTLPPVPLRRGAHIPKVQKRKMCETKAVSQSSPSGEDSSEDFFSSPFAAKDEDEDEDEDSKASKPEAADAISVSNSGGKPSSSFAKDPLCSRARSPNRSSSLSSQWMIFSMSPKKLERAAISVRSLIHHTLPNKSSLLRMIDPTLLKKSQLLAIEREAGIEKWINTQLESHYKAFLSRSGENIFTREFYRIFMEFPYKARIRSQAAVICKAMPIISQLPEPHASLAHIDIVHQDSLMFFEKKISYRLVATSLNKEKAVSRGVYAIGWIGTVAYILSVSFYIMLFGLRHTVNIMYLWLLCFLLGFFQDLIIILPVRILFFYRALPSLVSRKVNVSKIKSLSPDTASSFIAQELPHLNSSKMMGSSIDEELQNELRHVFRHRIEFERGKKRAGLYKYCLGPAVLTSVWLFTLLPYSVQDFCIDAGLACVAGIFVALVWGWAATNQALLIFIICLFASLVLLLIFRNECRQLLTEIRSGRWKCKRKIAL